MTAPTMTPFYHKRWFGLLVLVVVIVPALWLRVWSWQSHFTHIDDLLVYQYLTQPTAWDVGIARAKEGGAEPSHFAKLDNAAAPISKAVADTGVRYATLRRSESQEAVANWMYGHGLCVLADFYHYINPARLVWPSRNSTYAPGQYLLFGPLINDYGDYRLNLMMGRLGSFLFGIVGVGLLAAVLFRLRVNHWVIISVVSMLAYSPEHIIYSSQMSPYAGGVVMMLALFWVVSGPGWHLELGDKPPAATDVRPWVKQLIVVGAIGCVFQFQVLFVLPALGLVTWGLVPITTIIGKVQWLTRHLWFQIGLLGGTVLTLFVFFLRNKAAKGINWNAGPDLAFLFTLPDGLGDKLVYAFSFWVTNTKWVLLSTLTPLSYEWADGLVGSFVAVMLALLIAFGAYLGWHGGAVRRRLVLFAGIVLLTWVLMVLGQLVTYSPTRHSLIYGPVLLLLMSFGLDHLAQQVYGWLWPSCLTLAVLTVAALGLRHFKETRNNRFDPVRIQRLMQDHQPNAIMAYDWSSSVLLMRANIPKIPILIINDGQPNLNLFRPPFGPVLRQPIRRLMCLSERLPLIGLKAGHVVLMQPLFPLDQPSQYKILYQQELPSETQIEFYPLTLNGTNARYITVFERQD